ncbi:MAG: hypothetical protein HY075_06350 [Deltaproteobacteria bacterium]|nr:hypothetical protein [Deltaproteobacteria bacterium]
MGTGTLLIALLVFGQAHAADAPDAGPTLPPAAEKTLEKWPIATPDPAGCKDGAAGAIAPGPENCGIRKRYLESKLASPLKVEDAVDAAVDKNSKVVFFGEDHLFPEGRRAYPELFGLVKKKLPEVDCIFLECKDPKGTRQKAIDRYLAGKGSYPALKDAMGCFNSTQSLLDFAKSQHLKVIPVDTEGGLDPRNEFMTDQIAKRLDASACHKGIMPVGKRHVSGERSIADRLKAKGIGVSSLNVQTSEREDEDMGNEWYRPDCDWNPPRQKERLGFLTRDAAGPTMEKQLVPTQKPGSWNRFDATILIPASPKP